MNLYPSLKIMQFLYKKLIHNWHAFIWLLFMTVCANNFVAQPYNEPIIRVLLDEIVNPSNQPQKITRSYKEDANKPKSWKLKAKDGFWICDFEKKQKKLLPVSEISITYRNGFLYIQGQKIADRVLHLIAVKGNIAFENKNYHGLFTIMAHEKGAYCINHVHLEDYVYCVLRTESWPGWPLEVNKVFAIASRSYAVAMMHKARKLKKPYDVRNTNAHQTYAGIHQIEILKKAVELTKGKILVYENQPIIAMFDACCGGITPAHIGYFNFKKAPYLARTYPCKHCKKSKVFSWKVELNQSQLRERIASVIDAKRIHDVTIAKKDKAGVIEEVHFHGSGQKVAVTGKKFYSLFKEIKSNCYKIRKHGNKFLINGWGYGHHIGLCQWGAREMVREGWPYKQILQFYYPNTELRTLNL